MVVLSVTLQEHCSPCIPSALVWRRPAVMIAYLISGAVATLTALCYAE
jgi:amino acid transporter